MHSAEGIECVEVFLFLEVSLKHSLSQIIVITTALVRGYVCGGGEYGRGRYGGGGGGDGEGGEGGDGVKVLVRVVAKVVVVVLEMLVVVQ